MNTTSSLLSFWVLLLLHNQPIYVYGGSTCSLHVSWEPHFASHFSAKWKEKKYCFSLRCSFMMHVNMNFTLSIVICLEYFEYFFMILVLLQLILICISNSKPFYHHSGIKATKVLNRNSNQTSSNSVSVYLFRHLLIGISFAPLTESCRNP